MSALNRNRIFFLTSVKGTQYYARRGDLTRASGGHVVGCGSKPQQGREERGKGKGRE